MRTIGQWRVNVDFNPGQNPEVAEIKSQAAAFIDTLHEKRTELWVRQMKAAGTSGEAELLTEAIGLLDQAMRTVEDAAMYAVKGVTKRVRD